MLWLCFCHYCHQLQGCPWSLSLPPSFPFLCPHCFFSPALTRPGREGPSSSYLPRTPAVGGRQHKQDPPPPLSTPGAPPLPIPQAFGMSVCSKKAVQEPVPATKRGLLRLSPTTHTTTSTTVGDPEPAETPMLSSLPPRDFCGVADLTSIVQMWKLRLTKVKPLAMVPKQRRAWKTVAPPQSQHP